MTREEALEKCGFINKAVDVICVLEALGLLKFEEKREKRTQSIIIQDVLIKYGCMSVSKIAADIINKLLSENYKIVDTDINVVSSPRPVPYEHRLRDTTTACRDFLDAGDKAAVEKAIKQFKNCLAEW